MIESGRKLHVHGHRGMFQYSTSKKSEISELDYWNAQLMHL